MKTINDYAELVKEKHALNKTIAPVETNETDASRAYAVGEQLIFNGTLYDVIAPISQHDVITTTGSGANIAPAGSISAKIQTLTNKLSDEVETRAKLGAKNLMPFDLVTIKALNTTGTWNNNVYTLGNLTFTVNSDLSVTVNGTNGSSDVYLYLTSPNSYAARDWGGKKLSGATGGSNTTYRMYITASNNGTSWAGDISQYDDEIIIGSYPYYGSARIMISKNAVLSNVVFKPMICLASDSDPTYQPYAMTNRELTELATVEDLSSQVTLTENCFSCSLVRQGNICHVNVAAKSGVNGFTSIATIPEDLKPKYNTPMACFAVAGADSSKIADAVLNTNGLISIRTTSATSDIAYLSCTWIV